MTGRTLDMPAPGMAAPRPGDVVAGRYQIESEIGHGGFGAVYRANQVGLGRAVALKMLLPEMVTHDEGLSRFRREAQLAQRLEHPNTVRLYDFGQTELGLPYIAFELLRGLSLDHVLFQQGAMPPARVARIISQVLKSLMEAHGLGIIHRDIKPANVFLCEFSGESDFVKVLDFGIAKSTKTNQTQLTQAGHAIGTPNYMAPEQVRGETVTPAADVYSVGLLMAEMLTGQIVFKGMGTDVYLEQMSSNPVPLPSSLAFSPLGPIVQRATEKDLSRRYSTAGQMLQDIEAVARSGALERPGGTNITPLPQMVPPSATQMPTVVHSRPPPPGPAQPQGSSSTIWIVLLLLLVVVGGAAGIIYATSGKSSSSSGSDDDDPKKSYKIRSHDDDDKPPKKKPIRDEPIDPKNMKPRLEKLGWKVTGESTTKQADTTITSCYGTKGSQMAFVYVYDMKDENAVKMLETSIRAQKGSAVKREGTRLVWVMTSPADAKLSQEIIDDLDL